MAPMIAGGVSDSMGGQVSDSMGGQVSGEVDEDEVDQLQMYD
jgi:hypothetical protein